MGDPLDVFDALERLRDRWGRWYEITYDNGLFTAVRRDDGARWNCPDPDELYAEILLNYQADPVILPADLI